MWLHHSDVLIRQKPVPSDFLQVRIWGLKRRSKAETTRRDEATPKPKDYWAKIIESHENGKKAVKCTSLFSFADKNFLSRIIEHINLWDNEMIVIVARLS